MLYASSVPLASQPSGLQEEMAEIKAFHTGLLSEWR
jgi:hypothetical protein